MSPLPEAAEFVGPNPGGTYRPVTVSAGPTAYLAGQTARVGDKMIAEGVVGATVDTATALLCARQCGLNLLAHLEEFLGDRGRIDRMLRLTVYIAATADFSHHSEVADAASDVFLEALGPQRGAHARTAVGVQSLPRLSPVEIDATVGLTFTGSPLFEDRPGD